MREPVGAKPSKMIEIMIQVRSFCPFTGQTGIRMGRNVEV